MKKKKSYWTPKPLGKGQANQIVDAIIHPFFEKDKSFVLIDGLIHGLIEENPKVSVKKFVRYSLPELTKTAKKPERRCKKRARYRACTHSQ